MLTSFFAYNKNVVTGQNKLDLVDKLESYIQRVGSVFSRLLEGTKIRGPMATFSHGDCWNNNYMFRFEKDKDGREVPVEVKILDLQIGRLETVKTIIHRTHQSLNKSQSNLV
jgi:hypothetical protein